MCANLQLYTLWLPGNMNVNMTVLQEGQVLSVNRIGLDLLAALCAVDRYFRSAVLLHLIERYRIRIPSSSPPVLNETVGGFFQSV
jgi:hypothetical protein